MIGLTDEQLRRRLADRAAEAPAISLAAIARSVSAQPRRRAAAWGFRSALGGPIAAGIVIAVAVGVGLLTRSGSTLSSVAPLDSQSASGNPARVAAWDSLTWEQGDATSFISDQTIVNDAIAVGDGFVAVGTTTHGNALTGRVWRSSDGRTWERIDVKGIADLAPSRIVAVGETLVLLAVRETADGGRSETVELWQSTDGASSWIQGPSVPGPASPDVAAASPAGILLVANQSTFLINAELTEWVRTSTWPATTLLGTPAWAAGRWIQPGTTGTEANGEPSRAEIWTSSDARTWSQSTLEQSAGGIFRVLALGSGLIGIGTEDEVCLPCRGPVGPRSTVAWASQDGNTWRRVAWNAGLPRGLQAQFATDGRRVIVTGTLGFGSSQDPTFRILETVDGASLTPLTTRGGEPDSFALSGTVVVGRRGVVLLPGRSFDVSTGPFQPHVWWGAAVEADGSAPSAPPSPQPSPLVTGCDRLGFDARRCAAVLARALERAGSPDGVVATVVEPPDQSAGVLLGGGAPIATVDFTMADGTHLLEDVICGQTFDGISSDRACSDDPQIGVSGGVSTDVPCGATPGDENHPCATLPPKPRQATISASTPLILRVFDVRLDHVGHYEVLVGHASLPEGLLSERSGTLADPSPTTWWIDTGVAIVVRPGDPCMGARCQAIDSIYHEPFKGPRPVNVYLVFDVVELDAPGAILEIRNLIVR